MDEVLVSINCITYNHEKYIADALEGFLMQKTNFKYEILLHDDASTDKTAEIIRRYHARYPHLIKPMYQKENQYSKGLRVSLINVARAIGKYIADCEGDDYWIDPYKLQKQFDYMESNPECSMCFHDAILVDNDKTYLGPFPGHYNRTTEVKDIKELIFIPTASRVYRKHFLDVQNIPEWYYKSPYGDFASMLICSNHGYIYYINENMSAYRTNVPGSILYNARLRSKKNPEIRIDRLNSRINELLSYNEWSNFKNDSFVKEMILSEEFKKYSLERNFRQISSKKYKSIRQKMKFSIVLKIYTRCFIPRKVYQLLRKLKSAIIPN
ncbi:MAG: glycosyltransferase [Tissierellia bacterium]|nr:glycosyltransferase [Tissierellia bacterium]